MGYRNRNFGERFAQMGDQSEGIYEAARPLGKTTRFGWRRPKEISVKRMPVVLRHQPDYYAETGYLVEVMGMGRDGILRSLKVEKYQALKIWRAIARLLELDLAVFVWNSAKQQYVLLDWDAVVRLVAKARRKGIEKFENDGNEYFPILWEWIISEGKAITWSVDA